MIWRGVNSPKGFVTIVNGFPTHHEVPHRQFVFTIPRVLRGIFRKRRDLLHLLFQTATATVAGASCARPFAGRLAP